MVGKTKQTKKKSSASPAASSRHDSVDSAKSSAKSTSKSPIAKSKSPTTKPTTFGSRDAPAKKKNKTTSQRAGLVFPCSRFLNSLRKGNYAKIIQRGERLLKNRYTNTCKLHNGK